MLFQGIANWQSQSDSQSADDWRLAYDRPRGILSKADRKFLFGQKTYEHPQSEANRKQDIRERTVNALKDFWLLSYLLDDDEFEKIFKEEMEAKELQETLSSAISFIFLGLDGDLHKLEQVVNGGVYVGANRSKLGNFSGEVIDVNTSISVERRPDRTEIIEKYEEGDFSDLTPAQIGILVRIGEIESEDLDEMAQDNVKYNYFISKMAEETE